MLKKFNFYLFIYLFFNTYCYSYDYLGLDNNLNEVFINKKSISRLNNSILRVSYKLVFSDENKLKKFNVGDWFIYKVEIDCRKVNYSNLYSQGYSSGSVFDKIYKNKKIKAIVKNTSVDLVYKNACNLK